MLCAYSLSKRRKLDAKSKCEIFIGYNNQSKGYRVFILKMRRLKYQEMWSLKKVKYWTGIGKKKSRRPLLYYWMTYKCLENKP